MYVDAAYCYRRSSVVCRSVTIVSPAKTAEPIEMPFGLWIRMGLRNHVLEGSRSPYEGAILNERGGPLQRMGIAVVSCAETAEPIEMSFWIWTRVME